MDSNFWYQSFSHKYNSLKSEDGRRQAYHFHVWRKYMRKISECNSFGLNNEEGKQNLEISFLQVEWPSIVTSREQDVAYYLARLCRSWSSGK